MTLQVQNIANGNGTKTAKIIALLELGEPYFTTLKTMLSSLRN